MARQFFVGGNFKMNGSTESLKKLVDVLNDAKLDSSVEVVISPPAIFLIPVAQQVRKDIKVAAQNAYSEPSGAFTGEIALPQIKDIGLEWVILGHSERRTIFGETDDLIAKKTAAALKTGLKVIFCIGENLEQRESNKTKEVVTSQIAAVAKVIDPKDWASIVIAYEPVWAIGTGKVATPQQAQETHKDIRDFLKSSVSPEVAESTRVIYGGSVAAKNSAELATQPDIDGFLVGGASLKPEFVDIVNSNKAANL